MIIGLYVGMVVVAAALIANLSLTLAVVQRIRELESSSPGPGKMDSDSEPKPGHVIREFEAEALSGETVSRSAFAAGDSLAVFFMVNCAPCAKMIDAIASGAGPGGRDAVYFVTGDSQSDKAVEIAEKLRDRGRVVLLGNRGREVTEAFGGISSFPRVVSVRDGVVTRAEFTLPETGRPASGGRSSGLVSA